MLHIGCHLSVSQGFLHMGREALSLGADTWRCGQKVGPDMITKCQEV